VRRAGARRVRLRAARRRERKRVIWVSEKS